jgi:hypothetical protein
MRQPDLVALCETKLHRNSLLEIEGYKTVKSNLKAGKEGILLAAKQGSFNTIEKTYESELRNLATFEVNYPEETLRIIVAHGPQEDAAVEEKEEFYNDLKAEIERELSTGDRLMILGDFNARLEAGEDVTSKGSGKLLEEVISIYKLKVMNFSPLTEGKWTRIQLNKSREIKSTIDYVIADESTHMKLEKLTIDESKIFTPYHVKKEKGQKKVVFSDHCAMVITINIKPGHNLRKRKGENSKTWVLTEEGLTRFNEITQPDMGLGDMMSTHTTPYGEWMKKINHLMHKCFIKRTVRHGNRPVSMSGKSKRIRTILKEVSKRGKVQREVVKRYITKLIQMQAERDLKRKVEKVKETVSKITEDDVLSTNAFWKLRKSVSKKVDSHLHIVNKREGGTTTDQQEIKDEVKKEFVFRLRNREAHEEWMGYVDTTNAVVEELLKNQSQNITPFTIEELERGIKKMKTGTAPDYYNMYADVLAKAGVGALRSLLQVFNNIQSTCIIPVEWRNVLITMIYKNKGSRLNLEKYRGIFLTVVVSKLFERLLQERMKSPLKKVSLCQAGSRNGKGPPDQLYLLRSAVDHSKFMNNPIYITAYDFQQAFDSLWLQDCILVLKRLGVENHILKLVYEMNKVAVVQVKTPFGLTDPAEVYDIVKQGGVLGSPLCSASTAEYCGTNVGIVLGSVTIATLVFVDDVVDISGSEKDARKAHVNALEFALKKKLNFAPDKCFIMVVNGKRSHKVPDLFINGEMMEEAKIMKYLGDIFNHNGTNINLMDDRVARGTAAMVSIQGFIREICLGVHTISVHLLLYKSIFLASILFNSQAWSNLTESDIHKLSVLQLKFLKGIMKARKCTTNSFVYLELGVLPIIYEIHKRQLSFLHHIVHLEEEDPVKGVWRNQQSLPSYANWWRDVEGLLTKYSLNWTEGDIKSMSKDSFKRKVNDAVESKAVKELNDELAQKSRSRGLAYTGLERQRYLEELYPNQSRIAFRYRSKTLDIKEHTEYKYTDNTCRWCGISDETAVHIVNCGAEGRVLDEVEDVMSTCTDMVSVSMVVDRISSFCDKVET